MGLHERIEQVLKYADDHLGLSLLVCFLVGVGVRLYFMPIELILQYDSYYYVQKAIEISQGDWTPLLTHGMGYPILLSFFLKIFSITNIFTAMMMSRIVNTVLGSLIIFPLFFIARKVLSKRHLIVVLLLFITDTVLTQQGNISGSEPLYILAFTCMVYFLLLARENQWYFVPAVLMSAICTFTRLNGIFTFFVVLVALLFIARLKISISLLVKTAVMMILFVVLMSPLFIINFVTLGTAYPGGNQANFFADNTIDATNFNAGRVTFAEFVRNATLGDWVEKYLVFGVGFILIYFFFGATSTGTLPFLLVGFIEAQQFKKLKALLFLMVVYMIPFIPIFHIYNTPRYLAPLTPIILIFAAVGIWELVKNRSRVLFVVLIVGILLTSMFGTYLNVRHSRTEPSGTVQQWSYWGAENLEGTIGLIVYDAAIMMHLPDTTIGGGGMQTINSGASNISIRQIPAAASMEEAIPVYKEMGLNYIGVNYESVVELPYLAEVYDPRFTACFTKVYSSDQNIGDGIPLDFFEFTAENCSAFT